MSLALSSNNSVIRSRYIYIAVLLASLSIPLLHRSICQATTTPSTQSTMSTSTHPKTPSRTPVYFLSIGGPNFMEATTHPAYAKLASVGLEITTKVKPKAVLVFSAHWQNSPTKIAINTAQKTDLIYDFYGFPKHYYEYEYPNKGSPEVAEMVIGRLESAGIEVERVERGLDHGVWAGFMVGALPSPFFLSLPHILLHLHLHLCLCPPSIHPFVLEF
jgi:Catalytic LigB subunit of aromatic ring-opening dioxygenase